MLVGAPGTDPRSAPLVTLSAGATTRAIVDQAWAEEKGFRPSYYDVKSTLQEDAVQCHRAHQQRLIRDELLRALGLIPGARL